MEFQIMQGLSRYLGHDPSLLDNPSETHLEESFITFDLKSCLVFFISIYTYDILNHINLLIVSHALHVLIFLFYHPNNISFTPSNV